MIKIDCSIGQVKRLNSPMRCAIESTVVDIGTVNSAIECACRCQMISKGKCTQMSFNTDTECTILSTDQPPNTSPWSIPVQPAWTLYSIDIRGRLGDPETEFSIPQPCSNQVLISKVGWPTLSILLLTILDLNLTLGCLRFSAGFTIVLMCA